MDISKQFYTYVILNLNLFKLKLLKSHYFQVRINPFQLLATRLFGIECFVLNKRFPDQKIRLNQIVQVAAVVGLRGKKRLYSLVERVQLFIGGGTRLAQHAHIQAWTCVSYHHLQLFLFCLNYYYFFYC